VKKYVFYPLLGVLLFAGCNPQSATKTVHVNLSGLAQGSTITLATQDQNGTLTQDGNYTFTVSSMDALSIVDVTNNPNRPEKATSLQMCKLTTTQEDATITCEERAFFENTSTLWSTNGTAQGTYSLGQISPRHFTVMGNKLYFSACSGTYGCELWQSDGTLSGTHMLKDINVGTNSSYSFYNMSNRETSVKVFKNRLYFLAIDDIHGTELWSTDGTTEGTTMLPEMLDGNISDWPHEGFSFAVYHDELYLNAAAPSYSYGTWKITSPTQKTSILPSTMRASGFVVCNDQLYVSANDKSHSKLYAYDGTTLHEAPAIPNAYVLASNAPFACYENKLIFSSTDNQLALEKLWYLEDNTTHLFSSLTFPYSPLHAENALYFLAEDVSTNKELWRYQGDVVEKMTNLPYNFDMYYYVGEKFLIPMGKLGIYAYANGATTQLSIDQSYFYLDVLGSTHSHLYFRVNSSYDNTQAILLRTDGQTIEEIGRFADFNQTN